MTGYERYMREMGELACMLLLNAPEISLSPTADFDDREPWETHERQLAEAANALRSTVTGDHTLALTAIRVIRRQLDEYEQHHVRRMIADGESWSAIGKALGVSKQAAQQKYGREGGAK